MGGILWKSRLQSRASILFFFFSMAICGAKILGKRNILWVTHRTAPVPILSSWALGSVPFALLGRLSPFPPQPGAQWLLSHVLAKPRPRPKAEGPSRGPAGCREALSLRQLPRPVRSFLLLGACGHHHACRVLLSVSAGSEPAATLRTLWGECEAAGCGDRGPTPPPARPWETPPQPPPQPAFPFNARARQGARVPALEAPRQPRFPSPSPVPGVP